MWVCDLWWMGRKSKYVIEVLEEFAWWATKVFLSIAWENDDVLYSPCITLFNFLSQKIFLNDTFVAHKCCTLEFASDIQSKNLCCMFCSLKMSNILNIVNFSKYRLIVNHGTIIFIKQPKFRLIFFNDILDENYVTHGKVVYIMRHISVNKEMLELFIYPFNIHKKCLFSALWCRKPSSYLEMMKEQKGKRRVKI